MNADTPLPLFHSGNEIPDDQAFEFIHIETISARSSVHHGTIRTHRHRKLFQILLIEQGGGEMSFEATNVAFAAPCAILLPPTMAHGFRFQPEVTDGWVISFNEDMVVSIGDRRGEALARLKALASDPVVPLPTDHQRLVTFAAELAEEISFGRPGCRIAMHGLLALIAVEVARLAAGRERLNPPTPPDDVVAALRELIEKQFQAQRQLSFYACKLAMTVDRLNDHIRRATGVTAGHLIRQRILTEAKRQLVFSSQPIHEIARDLAFSDASHFARFFRKQTGAAPHEFRAASGG